MIETSFAEILAGRSPQQKRISFTTFRTKGLDSFCHYRGETAGNSLKNTSRVPAWATSVTSLLIVIVIVCLVVVLKESLLNHLPEKSLALPRLSAVLEKLSPFHHDLVWDLDSALSSRAHLSVISRGNRNLPKTRTSPRTSPARLHLVCPFWSQPRKKASPCGQNRAPTQGCQARLSIQRPTTHAAHHH